MTAKAKGQKGPTWVEYVLEKKESEGVSYREMARKCDMSDASWHALITGKGPPNYKRAKQLMKALQTADEEKLLNIVFKDRLLRWLKREGILSSYPTNQIHRFVSRILEWDPTSDKKKGGSGSPIGYIMSTLGENHGIGFASDIDQLCYDPHSRGRENRSGQFRIADFR